jgi:hypothetical protein
MTEHSQPKQYALLPRKLAFLLLLIGASQALIVVVDLLGHEWGWAPIEPIYYIMISVGVAPIILVALIVACIVIKPEKLWRLLALGTLGLLPSALLAAIAVAYVLELPLLFS